MMRMLIALFLLLSVNAAHALCAGRDLTAELRANDPDGFAGAESRAKTVANGEGLLWKITKDALPPSYLFGTYHLGVADENRSARRTLDLARSARKMFIEISSDEEAAMQAAFLTEPQVFMNAEAAPLSTWLSPELLAKAKERLPNVGMNLAIAGVMKPWMLSLLLALPPCILQQRANGVETMDQQLANAAIARGVPVEGLETWREQIGVFANADLEDQRDGVRLQLATDVDPEDMQATMRYYYNREEVMLIWELSLLQARNLITDRDVDAISAEWWNLIVTERNRNMLTAALPDLRKGGVLMAVGALHLPDDGGLVELIRAEGFEVTREN